MRLAVHSFEHDDFAEIVEAVYDVGGGCTLAIDEASTLCKGKTPCDALGWILAYGRHFGVEVVWTARRPAEVASLCTSQAEVFEAFRIDDPNDLEALKGPFGRAALQRLPTLERFEFVSSEEE